MIVMEESATILVVDDVEANASIIEHIIEHMGLKVKVAYSVAEAITHIREGLPDLIVTDITMPEVDGLEFLGMLKNNAVTREIPVIVVSGLDGDEQKEISFELGAADYITKPFHRKEVERRITNHLRLYQMNRELEEYNQRLEATIKQQYKKIEEEQKNILVALANVVQEEVEEDDHTHLENVSYNAQLLAQSLSFSEKYEDYITQDYIETIKVAALLHDVGKIGMGPLKEGEVRKEDEDIKEWHAQKGAHILSGIYRHCSQNRFLKMAIDIARYHHANWNCPQADLKIRNRFHFLPESFVLLAIMIICIKIRRQ